MTEMKWHVVYTRPRWEKKVADLLTRKKFEVFCPLNRVRKKWADRLKIVHEPLFSSYVFVRIPENQIGQVKKIDGVINFLYWLGKPAVIKDVEISMIQRFVGEHYNVQLERGRVNVNDMVSVTSGPLMDRVGKVIDIKTRTIKIVLPSLGYMMSAEVETENVEVLSSSPYRMQQFRSLANG